MHFIEQIFHIDPDAGSGLFELVMLLSVLAIGGLLVRQFLLANFKQKQ